MRTLIHSFRFSGVLSKSPLRLTFLLMFSLFLVSCSKEKYGDADILSSDPLVINGWISEFDNGVSFSYRTVISWPSIDQATVDKGSLHGYVDNGGTWLAMPFASTYASSSINMYFEYSVGSITVWVDGYDLSYNYSPSDFDGTRVRFVIVRPNVKSAHPEVDWSDYEQVEKIQEGKI
jgi:hypothetical protein